MSEVRGLKSLYFQVSDFRLPTSDFRPQASGFRFQDFLPFFLMTI